MAESTITYFNPVDFSFEKAANLEVILKWFQEEHAKKIEEEQKAKKAELSRVFAIPYCMFNGQVISIEIRINSVGGWNTDAPTVSIVSNKKSLNGAEDSKIRSHVKDQMNKVFPSKQQTKKLNFERTVDNEEDEEYGRRIFAALHKPPLSQRIKESAKKVGKKMVVGVAVAGLCVAALHVVGLHLLGFHMFRAAHALSEVILGLGAIGFGAVAANMFAKAKLNSQPTVSDLLEKEKHAKQTQDDTSTDNGLSTNRPEMSSESTNSSSLSSPASEDSLASLDDEFSSDYTGEQPSSPRLV